MIALPSDFLAAERLLEGPFGTDNDRFQAIIMAARRLVRVDAFYFCRVEHDAGLLRFVYTCDGDLYGPGRELPMGSGPTSRAVQSGAPVVIETVSAREGLAMNPFGHAETASRSAVHWPLWPTRPSGRPDAVLSVQSYASRAYGREALAAIEWLVLRASSILR